MLLLHHNWEQTPWQLTDIEVKGWANKARKVRLKFKEIEFKRAFFKNNPFIYIDVFAILKLVSRMIVVTMMTMIMIDFHNKSNAKLPSAIM